MAGAAIGYLALTIYVLQGAADLAKLIGPTGFTAYVQQKILKYMDEKKEIERHPMYFLWKLEQVSRD